MESTEPCHIKRREFELLVKTNAISTFIIRQRNDAYELSAKHRYENLEVVLEAARNKARTWKRLDTLMSYIKSIEPVPIPIRIER